MMKTGRVGPVLNLLQSHDFEVTQEDRTLVATSEDFNIHDWMTDEMAEWEIVEEIKNDY